MRISSHIDVYEPSEDDYRLFVANSMTYIFVSFRPPYLCPSEGSVAKCRGSWVVGRGRGSWVWVNVAGKNKIIVATFKPHRVYPARI